MSASLLLQVFGCAEILSVCPSYPDTINELEGLDIYSVPLLAEVIHTTKQHRYGYDLSQ